MGEIKESDVADAVGGAWDSISGGADDAWDTITSPGDWF